MAVQYTVNSESVNENLLFSETRFQKRLYTRRTVRKANLLYKRRSHVATSDDFEQRMSFGTFSNILMGLRIALNVKRSVMDDTTLVARNCASR